MEQIKTIQDLLGSESLEDVQQGLKVWKEHFRSDLNTFTKSVLVLGGEKDISYLVEPTNLVLHS